MKTSYKRIREFVLAANDYLSKYKEETKLKIAIAKMADRISIVNQQYEERREDIELDLANVDKNGSVLYTVVDGKRRYDFKKESIKELREKIKELEANEEGFEIQEQIISDLPQSLPNDYLKYFEGFVIEPKKSEQ